MVKLSVLTLPWAVRRRWLAHWAAANLAAAVLLGGVLLDGSFAWWDVGFEYPPLFVNAVALAVLMGVMVHNLLDERRAR